MQVCARALVSRWILEEAPVGLAGQQSQSAGGVTLGRNYPNPFNPETWIPFTIDQSLFDGGRRPVVSLKIYNVLAQLVAVPVVEGSGDLLNKLSLDWNGTGNYVAYWDGKYMGTNQDAASGVYVYQLEVDGVRKTQKMTIIK